METANQNDTRLVARGLLLYLFLAGAATTSPAGAARTITLDEALRLAEASPAVQSLTLEIERSRAEVRASGLRQNPEIFFSREEAAGTVDRFANVSLPFPLTRRLSIERAAARSGLEATEARTRFGRLEFRLHVRDLFTDLLAEQQGYETFSAGRSQLSELVEVLRAREAEGESSGFDRMRAERERAEVEVEWFSARASFSRAREKLAAIILVPAEDLVAVGSLEPSGALPARQDVTTLLVSRGDIVALETEAARSDQLTLAARRLAIPEPTFTAGMKTTVVDGTSDTGAVVSIAFGVPIFDRGQGGLGVARAEGALLRARREALAREAEGEACAALEDASARREAERAYAAAGDADELIRIARAAYEAGEMRILELLDAYRTALGARIRAIELKADARKAEGALNRAIGTEVVR